MACGDLRVCALQLALSAFTATAFRNVLIDTFAAVSIVHAGRDNRTIGETGTDRAGKKGEHQFTAARISAAAFGQKQGA